MKKLIILVWLVLIPISSNAVGNVCWIGNYYFPEGIVIDAKILSYDKTEFIDGYMQCQSNGLWKITKSI